MPPIKIYRKRFFFSFTTVSPVVCMSIVREGRSNRAKTLK
jgi:hypothetical protein